MLDMTNNNCYIFENCHISEKKSYVTRFSFSKYQPIFLIIRKTFHSSFRYWQMLDAAFLLRDAPRRIISTPEDESLFCAIFK